MSRRGPVNSPYLVVFNSEHRHRHRHRSTCHFTPFNRHCQTTTTTRRDDCPKAFPNRQTGCRPAKIGHLWVIESCSMTVRLRRRFGRKDLRKVADFFSSRSSVWAGLNRWGRATDKFNFIGFQVMAGYCVRGIQRINNEVYPHKVNTFSILLRILSTLQPIYRWLRQASVRQIIYLS